MAGKDYTPKHVAVAIADALTINRKSPEYNLGLAQLKEWHARCRAKRLGIKRKAKGTSKQSTVESRKYASRKRKAVAK